MVAEILSSHSCAVCEHATETHRAVGLRLSADHSGPLDGRFPGNWHPGGSAPVDLERECSQAFWIGWGIALNGKCRPLLPSYTSFHNVKYKFILTWPRLYLQCDQIRGWSLPGRAGRFPNGGKFGDQQNAR